MAGELLYSVIDSSVVHWWRADLLRERRRVLGLQEPEPLPVQRLLRHGAWVGAGCVVAVLLASGLFVLRNRYLAQREAALQPALERYNRLVKLRTQITKLTGVIETSNQAVVKGLLGLRSGSALVQELANLTPTGVRILSVEQAGNTLTLVGEAQEPEPFARANALLLRMQASGFFEPASVQLKEVGYGEYLSEQGGSQQQAPAAASADAGEDAFLSNAAWTITAEFVPDLLARNQRRLRELGALGTLRRLTVIQEAGLLP